MVETSEEDVLTSACEAVRRTGGLTEEQKRRLTNTFKGRFTTASETLGGGRVKKYIFRPSGRKVWVVAGRGWDYRILPLSNFCSCFDFYFRVMDHEISFCYHLIAQKLAEASGRYTIIEEADSNFIPFIEGWRKTLRETREMSIADVENVRKVAGEILLVEGGLSIGRLLERVKETGFRMMTTRHLSNILKADRAQRFRYGNGLWKLSE